MTEYSNGILFDRNILVNYSCFISLWLIWIITFHPVRGNFANEFYSYENCASNLIQKLCSMVLLCRKKKTIKLNSPYWFGITSGSVSSISGGSSWTIWWWFRCLESVTMILLPIGVADIPLDCGAGRTNGWAGSIWQSFGTVCSWVCFADFRFSSMLLFVGR